MLGERSKDPDVKSTLIIAPLSLIHQWKQEIESKSAKGSLRVIVHHGPTRVKDFRLFRRFDVVITTYSVVGSESQISKMKDRKNLALDDLIDPGVLFRHSWYRVVLDEAQNIKNRSTLTARAACLLRSERRLCLSGTPLQNSVEDMYSLFKFLRIKVHQHGQLNI
jgi:SNF2 family DNA or RNA helicase